MGKTAVVYQSKYGTTETYAKWIAEDTGADLMKARQTRISALLGYDTIIYCGGLYAGGMLGFSRIKKNYRRLKDKRLIAVAVGATLNRESALGEVTERNLSPQMRGRVRLFLLRGGLDYKRMGLLDRTLMALLVRSIRKKDPSTLDADSKGLLGTYGKTVSFVDRRLIAPVVQAVQEE